MSVRFTYFGMEFEVRRRLNGLMEYRFAGLGWWANAREALAIKGYRPGFRRLLKAAITQLEREANESKRKATRQ